MLHLPSLTHNSLIQDAWSEVLHTYRSEENSFVVKVMNDARFSVEARSRIQALTTEILKDQKRKKAWLGEMEDFIQSYGLDSEEGISLMVVAEALLRIPDADTANALIEERLGDLHWLDSLDKDRKAFVRLSALGLSIGTSFFEKLSGKKKGVTATIQKMGVPVARQAIKQAMKSLGRHFVIGQDIQEALDTTSDMDWYGYRFSYDMLGEAARTQDDAQKYYQSYLEAIEAIAEEYKKGDTYDLPGISIKLSALHPRYEPLKESQYKEELFSSARSLVLAAKEKNISVTIDAEETERLVPSLEIFEALYLDPALGNWTGLGLAVQAYQKRSAAVIDWLIALTQTYRRKIAVRLVKGAYWDSEIKKAQLQGVEDYPVFTRKEATDANYINCAKKLMLARGYIFPQFATHNAHTIASVLEIADSLPGGKREGFEFQRLYGMGHNLYQNIVYQYGLNIPCRVYAPVGKHKDLLPYLVRRLLENGANNSFVNLQAQSDVKIADLTADPVLSLSRYQSYRNDHIPLPPDLYSDRPNSPAIDLTDGLVRTQLQQQLNSFSKKQYEAKPIINGAEISTAISQDRYNPSNSSEHVGSCWHVTHEHIDLAFEAAATGHPIWSSCPVEKRAEILIEIARLLELNKFELYSLGIREAGKTIEDLVAEVREAIDFCYYYANQAAKLFEYKQELEGVTGERNLYKLSGRGVVACISPWNFPIAIYVGQIVAALVTGNSVLAKPSEQTSLVAYRLIQLMHEAGVPKEVLHFIPGKGRDLGDKLIQHEKLAMVCFTGSTETATYLQMQSLKREKGSIPFIAETGGQNVMIADSSALLEQLCDDVIASAFGSAGQRCSALRVLYVPAAIFDDFTSLLIGAVKELKLGNPAIFNSDIGPIIDGVSAQRIQDHVEAIKSKGGLVYQQSADHRLGAFVGPAILKIDHISELENEVFGPVLHLIRYQPQNIDQLIGEINQMGFGLTFGVHSRLRSFTDMVTQKIDVGNVYVNRSMTGAIVGVQPFGGDRKSGTGPKAGGPFYLSRFVKEKSISINLTAFGGNIDLLHS